jgi:hypothetical protein
MSAWAQHYPGFLELKSFDVLGSTELPDGRVEVSVTVTGRHAKEPRDYVFIMRRATIGKYKGCWCAAQRSAAQRSAAQRSAACRVLLAVLCARGTRHMC